MTDLAPELPTKLDSIRAVIDLWPTREALAADIGTNAWRVTKWHKRQRIPGEWWLHLLATDVARENGVTAELLATLSAPFARNRDDPDSPIPLP